MKILRFKSKHQEKHFQFFRKMAIPHFNICANVDITRFHGLVKNEQLHFTSCVAYAVARTGNEIVQFKRRIREEHIIEHDIVHPSFTILPEGEDAFSFCDVVYHEHFPSFYSSALKQIELRRSQPSLENEHGRDDYLFLSAIPWISFTSIQHAMPIPPDSVPRISWGKYFSMQDKILMPISVQAHHALVDGKHTGQFFEKIQAHLYEFARFLE
jgi:chloramphenicol O-acetyltransferase type A